MRKGRFAVVTGFGSLAVGMAACTVLLSRVYNSVLYYIISWAVTGMICIAPTVLCGKLELPRLGKCRNGCMQLFVFCISTVFTILYTILCIGNVLPAAYIPTKGRTWIFHILTAILVEAVVFWNGMIRIYLTSEQLGIKWRVLGAICGMIPIVNLIVLGKLLRLTMAEVSFENEKARLNRERRNEQICKTKYPILLVHGIFFRDFKLVNYWGRIPKELESNGATIFYGNHQSAASISACAQELDARIRQIVAETGCEKVNVIAHSKGGLDVRYALSELGTDKYVASLTTINTPHRGCEFADYLLNIVPEKEQCGVARAYNAVFKKLGDDSPDFLLGVKNLTASACKALNDKLHDAKDVLYQSVGSRQNVAGNGRFPLNYTYRLVKYFDGANDGLVGENSFPWGNSFEYLTVEGKRGISHGDVIDLNRENIPGFDVREFYVKLVHDLKTRGY